MPRWLIQGLWPESQSLGGQRNLGNQGSGPPSRAAPPLPRRAAAPQREAPGLSGKLRPSPTHPAGSCPAGRDFEQRDSTPTIFWPRPRRPHAGCARSIVVRTADGVRLRARAAGLSFLPGLFAAFGAAAARGGRVVFAARLQLQALRNLPPRQVPGLRGQLWPPYCSFL